MSDETRGKTRAAPFTPEDRVTLCRWVARWGNDYRPASPRHLQEGYEATCQQLEAALAAAEQERDEQRQDTASWYRQVQVLNAANDALEERLAVAEQERDELKGAPDG